MGPILKALSGGGVVDLLGPVRRVPPGDLLGDRPNTLIVMAGRPESEGWEARLLPGAGTPVPQVLLRLDHSDLETQALYDFAEDFVVEPCSAAEVEKRLLRLAARTAPEPSADVLCLGAIALNVVNYQVGVAGTRVDLAWMEFQLLRYLMENSGRIYTRDHLLSAVWGVDGFGGTRTVDVHIRRLRQKLRLQGNASIRTVANVGYGLIQR